MTKTESHTPYYVLLNGNHRIGPEVTTLHSPADCSFIYGFSDKEPYEKFRLNSQLALTPYPLVKFYLKGQIEESTDTLKLVVIDATGPCEPIVHAATMNAVLEAHESGTNQLNAPYELNFDHEFKVYRLSAIEN